MDRSESFDFKSYPPLQEAVSKLLANGYCPACAEALLDFLGEMLRKEE